MRIETRITDPERLASEIGARHRSFTEAPRAGPTTTAARVSSSCSEPRFFGDDAQRWCRPRCTDTSTKPGEIAPRPAWLAEKPCRSSNLDLHVVGATKHVATVGARMSPLSPVLGGE